MVKTPSIGDNYTAEGMIRGYTLKGSLIVTHPLFLTSGLMINLMNYSNNKQARSPQTIITILQLRHNLLNLGGPIIPAKESNTIEKVATATSSNTI